MRKKLGRLALFTVTALVACANGTKRPVAIPPAHGTLARDGFGQDCLDAALRAWARRVPPEAGPIGNPLAMPGEHDPAKLTPVDPATLAKAREDLTTTLEIRRSLLAEPRLSLAARSIKILTRDGKVTLRGAVDDPKERRLVEALARAAAGPRTVESKL